jgi:hypothetical protein
VYHHHYHKGKCMIGTDWNSSKEQKSPVGVAVEDSVARFRRRFDSETSNANSEPPVSIPLMNIIVEKVAGFLSPDTRWVVVKSEITADNLQRLNAYLDYQRSDHSNFDKVVASSIDDPTVLLGWKVRLFAST